MWTWGDPGCDHGRRWQEDRRLKVQRPELGMRTEKRSKKEHMRAQQEGRLVKRTRERPAFKKRKVVGLGLGGNGGVTGLSELGSSGLRAALRSSVWTKGM